MIEWVTQFQTVLTFMGIGDIAIKAISSYFVRYSNIIANQLNKTGFKMEAQPNCSYKVKDRGWFGLVSGSSSTTRRQESKIRSNQTQNKMRLQVRGGQVKQ